MINLCPNCGTETGTLDIEFTFATGEVKSGGVACRLSQTEMRILECLIDAFPRALSIDGLFAEVYGDRGDDMPELRVINTTVANMRTKLQGSRVPLGILTVSNGRDASGFALVPEVGQPFIQRVA